MIEVIPGQPDNILEFRASGKVTGGDYEKVVFPAIEEALYRTERVRVLFELDESFTGYDFAGLVDDTKLGLRHWTGFERIALVSAKGWLRDLVRGIGFALPCPVRTFQPSQLDEARRWLRESIGSIHLGFDESADLVTVALLGKLEPSAYDDIDEELDGWLSKRDRMRLLLDLRRFDGWQGLAAIGQHLSLVSEYRKRPERVAVVGDAAWQRLAARIMKRFVNAEVRYFAADAFASAESWVRR